MLWLAARCAAGRAKVNSLRANSPTLCKTRPLITSSCGLQRPSLVYLYALPAFGARSFWLLLRPQERPYTLERLEPCLPEVSRCPHAPLARHEDVGDHAEQ